MKDYQRIKNSTGTHDHGNDAGALGTISELLGCGQENAIPKHEIMRRLDIRSDHQFFSILSQERAAGTPILSGGNAGYYLPSDNPEQARAELQAFKVRQTKTARSLLASMRCVTHALHETRGQLSIDGIA